jgi:hypothetical protein
MHHTGLVRAFPCLHLVFGKTTDWRIGALRAFGFGSIPAALVTLGAFLDGTLTSTPGNPPGLVTHLGFWGFFLTGPIIAFLTWLTLLRTEAICASLPSFNVGERFPRALREILARERRRLTRRSLRRDLLPVFALVGVFGTLLNVRMGMNPLRYWGADCFDCVGHPFGYFAAKLYIALTLVYLYPTAIFVGVFVTLALVRVLRFMRVENLFRIDLFHSDNCGGVSSFGALNAIILGVYFCVAAQILILIVSHTQYIAAQVLPLCVVSILIVAQSIIAVLSIHRVVQNRKKEALKVVNEHLNREFSDLPAKGKFPDELLSIRAHLLSIKTFPYSREVSVIVNFFRLAPALVAVAHIFSNGTRP